MEDNESIQIQSGQKVKAGPPAMLSRTVIRMSRLA